MERLGTCRFDPLSEVALPSGIVMWTPHQYYDGAGWVALPEREKLIMRPTRWADARLRFLDPVDELPDVFKTVQSGAFDVKCWSRGDCQLGIEGDKTVFIKAPFANDVAVYVHPDRLPAFPKSWKPLVFLLNESVGTFRLTENLCLVLTVQQDKTMSISCVDYNGGFACAHPKTNVAAAYGSYVVKGFEKLPQCEVIPKMVTSSGDWGFFVQFYEWGFLFIPKSVELIRPQSVLGAVGVGRRVETVGLIFHPPNMFIHVKLDIPPKTTRNIEFGKHFQITAKKTSETDIEVYLVLDNQLAKYSYSFDIRVNKPEKPKHTDHIHFKCNVEPDEKKKTDPKYKLTASKDSAVLMGQGCPSGSPSEQLVNEQVIAYYDAEICMYYTHPPALKLSKAFADVAICE
ncbi:S15 sporozoite-expressed protein [Besnoitia besnoiti]|uniref:S15 sporozoite-expressed protein n=1 Tax=Besnoitia besnoiti TaxID=94643 RepID=A0A2A9MC15_BESBE|nr:S15 sporozoite-expressed protein [Besnoitia besnoiti]PFH34764.1 S15 sporozoite-expressed protein [Besnoitia besnoiti]